MHPWDPGSRPETMTCPPTLWPGLWATLWGSHLGRLSLGMYPASAGTQWRCLGMSPRQSWEVQGEAPFAVLAPALPHSSGQMVPSSSPSSLRDSLSFCSLNHSLGEKAQVVPCSLDLSSPIRQEAGGLCEVCTEGNPLPAVHSWEGLSRGLTLGGQLPLLRSGKLEVPDGSCFPPADSYQCPGAAQSRSFPQGIHQTLMEYLLGVSWLWDGEE